MALINETSAAFQEPDARVAVAAVLETLAADCDPVTDADGGVSWPMLGAATLRRLAAEVKEHGGG